MLKLMRNKAQSTAEYAIVIGLVIAAAVGMQIYVKRGLQGKVRDATNYTDSSAAGKYGITDTTLAQVDSADTQYEPYYNTETNLVSESKRAETSEILTGGGVKKETLKIEAGKEQKTYRTGAVGVEPSPNN